jgi:phospholipid-translocating ATPase
MIFLQAKYKTASMVLTQRGARVASVIETLERDMELLCVTGVEDSLQDNVKGTLELLKNAGLKVISLARFFISFLAQQLASCLNFAATNMCCTRCSESFGFIFQITKPGEVQWVLRKFCRKLVSQVRK